MLEAPFYVYPENQCLDVNNSEKRKITFTFNGDYLSSVRYRITDYDTNQIVTEFENTFNGGRIYNGEIASSDIYDITNGKNYLLQMLLTQNPQNASKYDMVQLRGTLQTEFVSENGTAVPDSMKTVGISKCAKIKTIETDSGRETTLEIEGDKLYDYMRVELDYIEYDVECIKGEIDMVIYTDALDNVLYATNLINIEGNKYYLGVPENAKYAYINTLKGDGYPAIAKRPAAYGRLTVEKGITNIYEWDRVNQESHNGWRERTFFNNKIELAANMLISINGETFTINTYNEKEGLLAVAETITHNIPKGTPYIVYSNYLVTPQYYFTTSATPQIINDKLEIVTSKTSDRYALPFDMRLTAECETEDDLLIDYYTVDLYTGDSVECATEASDGKERDNAVWTKLASSERMYKQKITARFSKCVFPNVNVFDYGVGRSYKAVLNIVMANKMTLSKRIYTIFKPYTPKDEEIVDWDLALEMIDNSNIFAKDELGNDVCGTGVKINTTTRIPSSFRLCISRYNEETRELRAVPKYDWTVPHKSSYIYYGALVVEKDGEYVYYSDVKHKIARIDFEGYTISRLVKSEGDQVFTKPIYYIEETWRFLGEVNDGAINNNVDKVIHTGYSRYPVQTSTNVRYESGSVSAILGYVVPQGDDEIYEDDIELIKRFRDFITKPNMYMLKSPKGDVWIVNITESHTEYEDYKDSATKINFSWAECESIDNLIIYREKAFSL